MESNVIISNYQGSGPRGLVSNSRRNFGGLGLGLEVALPRLGLEQVWPWPLPWPQRGMALALV